MNSRERVITALERKIPDRVPTFEIIIDENVIKKIIPGADLYDFVEKMELDGVNLRPSFKLEKIDKNLFEEERGIIYKYTNENILDPLNKVIKNEKNLKKFEFPDPKDSNILLDLQKAINRFNKKIAIISNLRYGLTEVRNLHGFTETLIDFVDNPKLIKGIIEKASDYYIELGKLTAKLGIEIVASTDDIAGKNGLLMSPYHFKEIVYPAMKRVYKSWKKEGLYIVTHLDGNISAIMDLLLETDTDCIHSIDPTAGMDLKKFKEEYGKRICIMGNVNCAGNLVFGTENDVIEEVKQCINVAAKGGGYIISTCNSILSSTKPENYVAMINAVKKYGNYPTG